VLLAEQYVQPAKLTQLWQSENDEHDVTQVSREESVFSAGQLFLAVIERMHSLVEVHHEHLTLLESEIEFVHVSQLLPAQSSAQSPNFHLEQGFKGNDVPSRVPGAQLCELSHQPQPAVAKH
jgi:hypothetical protein